MPRQLNHHIFSWKLTFKFLHLFAQVSQQQLSVNFPRSVCSSQIQKITVHTNFINSTGLYAFRIRLDSSIFRIWSGLYTTTENTTQSHKSKKGLKKLNFPGLNQNITIPFSGGGPPVRCAPILTQVKTLSSLSLFYLLKVKWTSPYSWKNNLGGRGE